MAVTEAIKAVFWAKADFDAAVSGNLVGGRC
jgi:hypothetical protein